MPSSEGGERMRDKSIKERRIPHKISSKQFKEEEEASLSQRLDDEKLTGLE
jgi:hypothetical protein